ncbi:MAG: FixH family protein [Microscillaceae bacterium]|nr:FixH family protein [Microscillaceae bacterium]
MNWGYKIALLYTGFAVFMLTLVSLTFQYKVNLVAKDYYKQEMAYQVEIDKMNNVNQLGEKPTLSYNTVANVLDLRIPAEQAEGEILFFRPSDASKDFSIPLLLHNQVQSIPCQELPEGVWRLKINWRSEGKSFYLEQRIRVAENGKVELLPNLDKKEKLNR